jgi:hypothetical protein
LPHRCGAGAGAGAGGCGGRCKSPGWLVRSRPTPSPLVGARSARPALPIQFSRCVDAVGADGLILPPKTANDPPRRPIFFVSTDPRRCIDIRATHRVPADKNPQNGAD